MSRKVLVVMSVLALIATGCSRTAKGPLRYQVVLDAKSNAKEKFQFSAFFPGEFRVSPGDSIKFRNRSTEAPHTVTFGVTADRQNQPPIITQTGENPVVLEKCYSKDAPTTKMVDCPSKRLPAYDGQGYWNSGFLQPKPAAKSAGAKAITLKLAKDIPAGTYAFVCILHPLMNGSLTVTDDVKDRSKPKDIRADAKDAIAQSRKDAEALDTPTLERKGNEVIVTAGWGDRITSVNRFAPGEIDVKAGTKVTWMTRGTYEPHTVTFEPTSKINPFAPGGAKSGSDYSGGFANSGIMGPKGSPFEGTYSLVFAKAGTYGYSCMLHPGQEGTVKVS
jgi:plastocyanin